MGIPQSPSCHIPNQDKSIKLVNTINNKREFGARVRDLHSNGTETIQSKSFGGGGGGGGGIGNKASNNSSGGGLGARVSGFNNNADVGNSDDNEDN
jgi:hypothetical protein